MSKYKALRDELEKRVQLEHSIRSILPQLLAALDEAEKAQCRACGGSGSIETQSGVMSGVCLTCGGSGSRIAELEAELADEHGRLERSVLDVSRRDDEIAALKAQLADCTASHQRQNATVARLEDEVDRLEAALQKAETALTRLKHNGILEAIIYFAEREKESK